MSLRSSKLLRATADLLKTAADFESPEDLVICRYYRTFFEENYGIRFAPPAIANHFSQENVMQPWSTFSFHGISLLPIFYKTQLEFLFENLGPQNDAKMWCLQQSCQRLGNKAIRAFESFQKKT